jgi:hypothetical protein
MCVSSPSFCSFRLSLTHPLLDRASSKLVRFSSRRASRLTFPGRSSRLPVRPLLLFRLSPPSFVNHFVPPRSLDGDVLELRCEGRDQRLRTWVEALFGGTGLRLPLPRLPPPAEQRQQYVSPSLPFSPYPALTWLPPVDARALFERTVALIEPVKAKPIWDRMAQFEFQCGDYLAAQKMAKRYAEAFPESTFSPLSSSFLSLLAVLRRLRSLRLHQPDDSLRTASATVRFAQQHKYPGLEDAFAQDLGHSFVKQIKDERRPRSPSPPPSRNKRGVSVEPTNGGEQDPKRVRLGPSPSPAPSSQHGWPAGGPQQPGFGGRGPPEAAPALNRPLPYLLDPSGHNVAVLPDAVVFFLSLLPPASAFNGPHLNPANIMDLIGTTILPGSAPGPGLPGERLGVPPRPKPQRPAGYGGGPPAGASLFFLALPSLLKLTLLSILAGPPGGGWAGRRY